MFKLYGQCHNNVMYFFSVLFLTFCGLTVIYSPAHAGQKKNVLLLNSYSYDQKWTRSITEAVSKIFRNSANAQLVVEFMDTKRHSSPEYYSDLYKLYKNKYQDANFDVVITSDDNAVNFALKYRDQLFPHTPIVFCGVNNIALPDRKDFKNITGALEIPGVRNTLELILNLQPKTKRIYLINETNTSGKSDREMLNRVLEEFDDRLEVFWLEDFEEKELEKRLSKLKEGDAVLLLSFFRDKKGGTFTISEGASFVSHASPQPVFSMWEYFLGEGIVGGMLTSGTYQGLAAADMALRVLGGEKSEDIPVIAETANQFMFDYEQLARFEIDLDSLPDRSVVINQPSTMLRKYKIQLATATLVILILVFACVALSLNIRARRNAELAMLKSEKQFRDLFDNSPLSLWEEDLSEVRKIIDSLKATGIQDVGEHFRNNPDDLGQCLKSINIVSLNQASVQLYHAESEEDLRLHLHKTFTEDAWRVFREEVEALSRGERHFRSEVALNTLSGERIVAMLYLDVISGYEESLEKVLITFVDITEAKRTEAIMVQTEKMMSVGGLAAGMAHEINNPLAGILGAVQNIHRRIFNDIAANKAVAESCGISLDDLRQYSEQRGILKMLESIKDAGIRASNIVQNMLQFSRKSDQSFEFIDMGELLDKTIELAASDYNLKKEYDFRKIKILREYDSHAPKAYCVGNEIQQVFFNILKNGAEAMAEKEYSDESPMFSLRVKTGKDRVVVEIEDNGPGVDEMFRKNIFDPFYTTKGVGKGTGLGLSVSYFIITELHKGAMEVESTVGKHTRFILYLPVAPISTYKHININTA